MEKVNPLDKSNIRVLDRSTGTSFFELRGKGGIEDTMTILIDIPTYKDQALNII